MLGNLTEIISRKLQYPKEGITMNEDKELCRFCRGNIPEERRSEIMADVLVPISSLYCSDYCEERDLELKLDEIFPKK